MEIEVGEDELAAYERLRARVLAARLDERDIPCLVTIAVLVDDAASRTQQVQHDIAIRVRNALSINDIAGATADAIADALCSIVDQGVPAALDDELCNQVLARVAEASRVEIIALAKSVIDRELSLLIDRGVDALSNMPEFIGARGSLQGLSAWNKLLVLLANRRAREAEQRSRKRRKGRG